MTTKQAGWTEEDSAAFIESGKVFTPARERQHEIVCELLASAVEDDGLIVELCSGAGDLARTVLERFDRARLLAFDGSSKMRAETEATCAAYADRLETRDFDLAQHDWRAFDPAPDAVYSSLAVHHLDGPQKRELFRNLLVGLKPGGLFVLADLMLPAGAVGYRIAAKDWDQAVAERSQALIGDDRAVADFAQLRWNYYLWPDEDEIDKPSSVAEHLAWLAEAGFVEADLHWMQAGHAILSARKPR